MKRQLIIGITLLITGLSVIGAQELTNSGNNWTLKYEKSYPVRPDGLLKLEDISADVTISTWDKTEVYIEAVHKFRVFTEDEAKAVSERIKDQIEKQENTVYISGKEPQKKNVSTRYRIQVPVKFNCEAEVGGGDLDISRLDGKLSANVGGGDVMIKDITGPLSLHVGGGDVLLYDCRQAVTLNIGGGDLSIERCMASLDIKVGGGDVEIKDCIGPVSVNIGGGDLSVAKIQKQTDIKAGGGDVEIRETTGGLTCKVGGGSVGLYNGSGRITVETGAGDIEARFDRTPAAGSVISLKTNIGDLELMLAGNVKATLDITLRKLHPFSDEEIHSDFPLKMNGGDKDRENRIKAGAELNGGGPVIQLEAKGGDISIEKIN